VPEGVIKLRKRLVSLTDLDAEGVHLIFEDGEEVVADLVVGGDGIRSVFLPPWSSVANCSAIGGSANCLP
jgi:hypothetical protein